jgi:hypothetical protein
MRRALAALALPLVALACSRDLEVPTSSPPRIDTVALVGLEPKAVPSDLHVLGGELVAIHGGGFPPDPAEVEVRIGSEDAEVLDARPDRVVARVPALAAFGPADLQIRTASGFRTQEGAFRYDGPGQPLGFGTSDVDTSVDVGFVAPVRPPGDRGFSDLAVALGASDSALVTVPALGLAVATIPLGLVPSSAAAWMDAVTIGTIVNVPRLNVLAVGRGGDAALGTATLDGTSLRGRAVPKQLAHPLVNPHPCALPQLVATYLGTPVATWAEGALADDHKLATIDMDAAYAGTLAPLGGEAAIQSVPAAVSGWGPWGASSIVFAAGSELYAYDAAAPGTAHDVLRLAKGGVLPAVPVTSLLTPPNPPLPEPQRCPGSVDFIYTLATATTGTSDALAVSYRAGGVDWVALVDLGPGPTVGTVWSGIAGTVPTSLALVPDPPFATSTAWSVLAAGGTTLFRFRPLDGAPPCGDLVADAAVALSDGTGFLPTFGGMTPAADGTRLLTTTPDRDLVTVLPPSLTSAGPIVRFASYGGVSIQRATIGGGEIPVAIAEHATFESSVSDLDTGSALLLVSLEDGGAVAIGGSGYGRGAVWLERAGGTKGALAYTGDLRKTPAAAFQRGGAASVTGFAAGQCQGEIVRIDASRPIASGPDLVLQGPARSGALGPDGIARFGPAVPPVYAVENGALHVYDADAATLACLAGEGGAPDWNPLDGTCAAGVVPLGVDPLDVTLSAGDRTAAVRTLAPCALPPTCDPDDDVCKRAVCPPASQLVLVRPDPDGATSLVRPLPAAPAAVAADRGGGFLVTMRCEPSGVAGGRACFPSDPADPCGAYLTAPGDENGALVLVAEDGSGLACLAVQPALAGPVAVTPNGAEAWVSGTTAAGQFLVRLGLPRRTSDGAIDTARPADLVAFETLHASLPAAGTPPPGGVAFTPEGGTGILTVPAQFRILLRE